MRATTFRSCAYSFFREIAALRSAESDLQRRYLQLRRAKNPSRALRVRFVTELVKLQLRAEMLDRALHVTE